MMAMIIEEVMSIVDSGGGSDDRDNSKLTWILEMMSK